MHEIFGVHAVLSGPNLMNRCKPERKDTTEHGEMINKLSSWKKERYLTGKLKGETLRKKRRVTRKDFKP